MMEDDQLEGSGDEQNGFVGDEMQEVVCSGSAQGRKFCCPLEYCGGIDPEDLELVESTSDDDNNDPGNDEDTTVAPLRDDAVTCFSQHEGKSLSCSHNDQ